MLIGRRNKKFREDNASCATKWAISDEETLLQFRLIKHPPVLIVRVYDKEIKKDEADNLS